jgi:hypothetical protein
MKRPAAAARPALCLVALLLFAGPVHNGQNIPHSSYPQPIGQPIGGGISDIPSGDSEQNEEQLRIMNKERHKSMVSDTNKLLRLAEIEKLAKEVKEKMSYSVRTGPVFHQPDGPVMR